MFFNKATFKKLDSNFLGIISIFCLFLIASVFWVFYINLLHPEVAFMDSLRYIRDTESVLSGAKSIFYFYGQGEHRGLLGPLFYLLNFKFFDFVAFQLSLLTYPIILTSILLLLFSANIYLYKYGFKRYYLASAFITILIMFSLGNWEILSLDVGYILFIKNLNFIFIWYLIYKNRSDKINIRLYILLVYILVTVFFLSGGWAYSFALSSILGLYFERKIFNKLRVLTLITTLLISIFLYAALGFFISSNFWSPNGVDSSAKDFLISVLIAPTSIFMGSESIDKYNVPLYIITLLGTFFYIFIGYVTYFYSKISSKNSLIFICMLFYGLLTIIAIAYARGRFGYHYAMAPRYFMDYSFVVIGLTWMISELLTHANEIKIKKFLLPTSFIFISVLVTGQFITFYDEVIKAPYRHNIFVKMKELTLLGFSKEADASLLQQPYESAKLGILAQRRNSLGPYNSITCDKPEIFGNYYKEPAQIWVGKSIDLVIKDCSGVINFGAYIPTNFPATEISISSNSLFKESADRRVFNLLPGEFRKIEYQVRNSYGYSNLEIKSSNTLNPSKINHLVSDNRDLGFVISNINTNP